jgi:sterol desaturase/sphingolipid hydroxylase (fatty acid hydroxylase superfamily)
MDWRHLLILLLIFLPLERLLPNRPEQAVLRNGWTTDVVYLLFNGFLIRMGWIGVLALAVPLIDAAAPADLQAFVASQPLWVQVPAVILIADFGFYLHHRLFHAVPFLWRFHAIHHSIEEMDWLAAHRVHPLDQLASTSMSVLPLLVLGFSAEAIAVHGLLYFLQSHLIHANTRLRMGPLEWLLASPHFHHWHHANAAAAHDRNFGGQTLIFDRLFGTLHLPQAFPARYGTDDALPADYPSQLTAPFKIRRRRFA